MPFLLIEEETYCLHGTYDDLNKARSAAEKAISCDIDNGCVVQDEDGTERRITTANDPSFGDINVTWGKIHEGLWSIGEGSTIFYFVADGVESVQDFIEHIEGLDL